MKNATVYSEFALAALADINADYDALLARAADAGEVLRLQALRAADIESLNVGYTEGYYAGVGEDVAADVAAYETACAKEAAREARNAKRRAAYAAKPPLFM